MLQDGTSTPERSRALETSGEPPDSGRAASRLEEPYPTLLRASADEHDPLIGLVVGSFRLVRKLGGGGMGTVYLGEHTLIGSKVAVKFLHEHFACNETVVQRFLAEARSVNLIGHENIINIFDMNVLPPRRHYLVMEYLEGQPLSALLGRPVAPPVVVTILTQVCDALQAAHARGVIHRDLKAENVFLIRRDRTPHFIKVLDFGIAKLLDRGASRAQTSLGTIIGTPESMAPEQWSGLPVDGRTDLYALGIIAYALLTGRRPFGGEGLGELLQAHLKQVPMSPHGVNPEVPAALSDIVMRAMAKRPEDRFQDAAELRATLERVMTAPVARTATPMANPVVRTATPMATPVARMPPPTGPGVRATPMAIPAPRVATSPAPAGQRTEHRVADIIAWVAFPPGTESTRMTCTDLTRAGAFLCAEGILPPLRSRVSLTLELRDRLMPCVGEVVRHVTPDQAPSWGMHPGFAVQFVDLSPEARDVLSRVSQGQAPPPVATRKTLPDDPQADALLAVLLQRMSSDPYVLLSLPLDATFDDVRRHLRAVQRNLEAIAARPLSARQVRDLAEMRSRVEKAADLLGHPRQRIEHDAWRGNFPGVARCISSGLTATEIESLRSRYLLAHPGSEVKGHIHATTAASCEAHGKIAPALTEYEKALTADPLNLPLQQRYWSLKRRDSRRGTSATPPPIRVKSPSGRFLNITRQQHPPT